MGNFSLQGSLTNTICKNSEWNFKDRICLNRDYLWLGVTRVFVYVYFTDVTRVFFIVGS